MNIQQSTQRRIEGFETGKIFTYKDLSSLYKDYPKAVAKGMERLVKNGVVVRQKPGFFYKPEQGRFGVLDVKESEILKQYTFENGRLIGYLSGPDAFRALGISTQVSNTITVATTKNRRRIEFDNFSIRFIQSKVKTIKKNDINKLQILDVLRQIKQAQDVSVDDALKKIASILGKYPEDEIVRICQLAKKYNPQVKALLGAILQNIGKYDLAEKMKVSLNPLTSYDIGVSFDVLPNKAGWSIS